MERTEFNIARGKSLDSTGLQYFEKCKEERLYTERYSEPLTNLLSPLVAFDQLYNKSVFLGFVSYLLSSQVRLVIEGVLRARAQGALVEISTPCSLEETTKQAELLLTRVDRRIRSLLQASGKVEYGETESRTYGL